MFLTPFPKLIYLIENRTGKMALFSISVYLKKIVCALIFSNKKHNLKDGTAQ